VVECYFNGVTHSGFERTSLKTERLNYQSFANHQEVVENVESYIYFYNTNAFAQYCTP
jgi:hypothetical protein